MKELYSFSVDVDKEIEQDVVKKKKNPKTGKMEEYTTTELVKTPVPYKIIIKDPSRRDLEEADIEYSIEMSKCIKRGILTKAMLAKKYSDSGGLLSEDDAKLLTKSYAELGSIQNKYSRLSSQPKKSKQDEKKLEELLGEMATLRRDIVDMETSYSSLFNHTADTKAQNKVLIWYLVHLSFYQESEEEEIIPFFDEVESVDKIDQYYDLDENGHEVFDLVKDKIATLISFWYFSTNVSREDFDKISEDIDSGNV